MYTVGINAHLLAGAPGYRRAGIHHYIASLIENLPNDPQMRYLVYTGPDIALRTGLTRRRSVWRTHTPVRRIAWEQAAWPLAALRDRLDLLHSLGFVTPVWSPAPTMVTIFDLSYWHYPDAFPPAQRRYLQTQSLRSCRQARRITTISAASRRDIQAITGVDETRIDIVYPAVAPHFQPPPPAQLAAFRRREQLPDRFILHVGTLQPRKNIPTLLRAFRHLAHPSLHLVLVGGKGWMHSEIDEHIEQLDLTGRVHFPGYVADAALPFWYAAAEALVYPSLYEGFGLPIVEAMACGTPVIAADTSSLPEAAGDAALLFPVMDAAALADSLNRLLADGALRERMRQRGFAQAAHFSWRAAGERQAAAYRKALSI